MSGAVAQFQMRRAAADRHGYYVTRWDNAVPMTVLAATEPEAITKADAFSGPPADGKHWTFIVDRIEELAPADAERADDNQRKPH